MKGISGISATYSINWDLNSKFQPGTEMAETIQEMIATDAIISQGVQYYHNILAGTEFQIKTEDEKTKEFLEEQLFKNPNFTFSGFIDKYFTAVEYGHSLHEYQFGLQNGKYTLKNLYFREQKTLVRWKVEGDKLLYIEQQGYDGDKYVSGVRLNKNLLLFSLSKGTGANYGGVSVLRSVFKPYVLKSNLLRELDILNDKFMLPTPIVHTKGIADVSSKNELIAAAQDIRTSEQAYVEVDDDGSDEVKRITFLEANIPDTKAQEFLNFLDVQIIKGLNLTHLSQGDLKSGSRAVGVVQERAFYEGIQRILKEGVENLNRTIIQKLVELNGLESARLTFVSPEKQSHGETIENLKTLVEVGAVKISEKDEEYFRGLLELPEKKQETQQKPKQEPEEPTEKLNEVKLAEVQDAEKKAEGRVDYSAIEVKLNQAEERTRTIYDEILGLIILAILNQVKFNGKVFQIDAQNSIEKKLINEIATNERDLFEFGKNTSANEIGEPKPKTSEKDTRKIKRRSSLITSKIVSDLIFVAERKQLDLASSEISKKEKLTQIEQALQKKAKTIAEVAVGNVAKPMNEGRRFSHNVYSGKKIIQAFKWSAVLDKNTCAFCSSMDGTIVKADSPIYEQNQPPIHNNCRCIWVAIKKTDGNIETADDLKTEQRDEFIKKQPTLTKEKDKFNYSEEITEYLDALIKENEQGANPKTNSTAGTEKQKAD